MKKTETFEQKIDRLVAETRANGKLDNDRYLLAIGPTCGGDVVSDEWTLRVFNKKGGTTEAFSSMKADFDPSLREFIEDYFA
jgi:hypothetical protein